MATTLILGASNNPERYANKAQKRLIENGHQVVLVNPKGGTIEGINCLTSLDLVNQPIDTITVYVRPEILESQLESIAKLKPKRIIFNPGSESPQASEYFNELGIEVVEACTRVMLTLGSY